MAIQLTPQKKRILTTIGGLTRGISCQATIKCRHFGIECEKNAQFMLVHVATHVMFSVN